VHHDDHLFARRPRIDALRPGCEGGCERAERAQAARDRETLAQMSERELHDIGLGRGYLDYATGGAWTRDASH
jgi:hypothetical protein